MSNTRRASETPISCGTPSRLGTQIPKPPAANMFAWPKRIEPRPSFRSIRRASGRRSIDTAVKAPNGPGREISSRCSVNAYRVFPRSQASNQKRPHITVIPITTNIRPQRTKKGPAPELAAVAVQITAKPIHTTLKGSKKASMVVNISPLAGLPDHTIRSFGRSRLENESLSKSTEPSPTTRRESIASERQNLQLSVSALPPSSELGATSANHPLRTFSHLLLR